MENDKTIFKYLLPLNNEKLSKLSMIDIFDLIAYINKYYLEYRDNLGFDKFNTFGVEIEFEYCWNNNCQIFAEIQRKLNKVVKNKRWSVVNDWSLVYGCEFVSEILLDENITWSKIHSACKLASEYGSIGVNCGAHVHIGSQVLGENTIYWKRFFKLWSIYENIIYRFCYGKDLSYRPNILKYATPAALFYNEALKTLSEGNYSVLQMLRLIEAHDDERYTKNYGVSYWRMLADNNYDIYEDYNVLNDGCTLEFRVPNGTLDEIIWQNNINLFMKMMLYCKSDRYNEDIIDKRKKLVEDNFSNIETYSEIYLEQVMEFSDLIFDNNLDKIYFLKQYLKNMDDRNNYFSLPKKLTIYDIR